ncbi:MAG: prolipoprotein diacylglyceryl transferase [Candidatus Hodarchaeota archaeon]
MRPRLVEYLESTIFGTSFFVPDYLLLHTVAILVGIHLALSAAERQRLDLGKVVLVLAMTLLVVFIGARLYLIIESLDNLSHTTISLSTFLHGGSASFGAYLGLILGAYIGASFFRLPKREFLDCLAPSVALGIVLGRIGCFLSGCCFGKPTDVIWAVRFPVGSYSYYAQLQTGLIEHHQSPLPVHPTQLYEALYTSLVFLILIMYRGKTPKQPGKLFALLFILYPMGRFIIEFFRGDDRAFVYFLSLPQVLSVVAVVLAICFFVGEERLLRMANMTAMVYRKNRARNLGFGLARK